MYDITKAERLLDFDPPTELVTGAATTIAWYRDEGYLPPGADHQAGSEE
jgi:nucleoside-diphosphate-sugar epimerase